MEMTFLFESRVFQASIAKPKNKMYDQRQQNSNEETSHFFQMITRCNSRMVYYGLPAILLLAVVFLSPTSLSGVTAEAVEDNKSGNLRLGRRAMEHSDDDDIHDFDSNHDDDAISVDDPSSTSVTARQKSLVLSRRFVRQAATAVELAQLVYEDDISSAPKVNQYRKLYSDANFFFAWYDGRNDATLLTKQRGVCYGVFRGTFQASWTDIRQNLDLSSHSVDGTSCNVRLGFYRAYYNKYQTNFEQKVKQCVASCGKTKDGKKRKCPLILTGHSQGAAVAIVASLALKQYQPTTLAFGPLKTVVTTSSNNDDNKEVCTDIDSNNVYTFVVASGGRYDDVPYRNPIGKTVGHVLLLDEGNTVAYTGRNDITRRQPFTRTIHAVELYKARVQELLREKDNNNNKNVNKGGPFPITITQWSDGHWCNYPDECNSKDCVENICTPMSYPKSQNNNKQKNKKNTKKPVKPVLRRTSGSPCTKDSECQSKSCHSNSCALGNGKLGIGAACTEHTDCDSSRCYDSSASSPLPWTGGGTSSSGICAPLRATGSFCNEDSDCLDEDCSGRRYPPDLKMRCQPPKKEEP